MKVCLTFDNGPDLAMTPYVLDVLREHQVPAIFFLLGNKLVDEESIALARRTLAEGHLIGNHSFTHTVPLGQCSADAAVGEIRDTQTRFAQLGIPSSLFRPFGGGGNLNRDLLHPAAVAYLIEHRMSCVIWNSLPKEWIDPEGWCDRALADVRRQDMTVVIVHDKVDRGMEHLPRFIREAKVMGAQFTHQLAPDAVPIRDGKLMWSVDHLMPEQRASGAAA